MEVQENWGPQRKNLPFMSSLLMNSAQLHYCPIASGPLIVGIPQVFSNIASRALPEPASSHIDHYCNSVGENISPEASAGLMVKFCSRDIIH